jgi:Rod binding domain-containing protein
MSLEWMSPLVNMPWSASNSAGTPASAGEKTSSGVEKACQDFEAYFTASLFSEMTKTLEIGEKTGSSGQEESWMWNLAGQTVAQELSRGEGLGLKKELLQSLSKSMGINPGGLD